VLVVLEALDRLADDVAARCHVCFAGKVESGIHKVLYARLERLKSSGTSAHIEVVDRYLDDDEIPPMVSGADVILAPYLRHVGSSGLLYWAAAAGKPVITQDYGLIGREARDFDLGLTVNTLSATELAEAMTIAIQANGRDLSDPDGQARFIEGHTGTDYAATLITSLAAACRS
jgi:glycosyltransferase involved in cell wall biosynthesis